MAQQQQPPEAQAGKVLRVITSRTHDTWLRRILLRVGSWLEVSFTVEVRTQ